MKLPFMPNKYNQPQPPPIAAVPEGQSMEQSGTYINESQRQIIVKICDAGGPGDLASALGCLEIAKDVVKNTLTQWHLRDRQKKVIIVPESPNGGISVH